MPEDNEARLRSYAGFAAAHAALVLAVLVVPAPPSWLWIAVFVSAAPFLLAWGHFHVHLAANGAVDETARTRWRSLLFLLPWSMALYWLLHVRGQ